MSDLLTRLTLRVSFEVKWDFIGVADVLSHVLPLGLS